MRDDSVAYAAMRITSLRGERRGNEACALPVELPRSRQLGGSRVSSRRNCGNGNDNSTAFPNDWNET